MTSPPDKLFRNGLENYRKPAPVSAWDRIESGLDHKRNNRMWMKIAAGLLLLIAAGTMLWNQDHNDIASAKTENKNVIKNEEIHDELSQSGTGEKMESNVKQYKEVDDDQFATNGLESKGKVETAKQISQPIASVIPENKPDEVAINKVDEPEDVVAGTNAVAEMELETNKDKANNVTDSRGTNIVYSAKEVNSKFLKPGASPEATMEKKTTSGFQKVLDKAFELQNEESLLAELREKKNEWLSINIPSKQRETNK